MKWKKVLGDPEGKKLKQYSKRAVKINQLKPKIQKKSDSELKERFEKLRQEVQNNSTSLDDCLEEVFAMVREASVRVLGMEHFDVQLVGGMALHEGNVAEMRTGEGKTLVATLPVALNALDGGGVHLVTVNDYLVQRDAGWMAGIYHFLGLSTAVIIPEKSFIYDPEYENDEHDDERMRHLKPCSRREAYEADITYGTNNEFGFDYLRDNISSTKPEDLRQRPLSFAIVDEVDSILIDEARTPLIISAPASKSGNNYGRFSDIVKRLTEEDYELDEKKRSVSLNDEGTAKVQKQLKVDNLYAPENVHMIYHLDQALRAQTLFKRDKDYVVADDGEVVIVDEFTGRLMHGRRYNEGLHQAIEAKEGVEVQQESMTLATISFQNYFRIYKKLSGMTGTAETEADEFFEIYGLGVVVVPTNKPIAREDKPDRIYRSEKAKFKAVVEEVKALNEKGQPVLIGTSSIEKNQTLSNLLRKAGVDHEVLNAKNNEREAAIVSKAGEKGAVTLATNIAGRGTDIQLGDGVVALGGLFVLGAERAEARRIDNQLRGRSGRQGDPGESQFYVSSEDELMRIFGGERLGSLMSKLGVDDDTPIENKSISKALENAQKKVESMNYDMRKNVVKYDDVMNRQRKSTYATRQEILRSTDIKERITDLVRREAKALAVVTPEADNYVDEIQSSIPINSKALKKVQAEQEATKREDALVDSALELYEEKEQEFGEEIMREMEREIYLQILDTNWMQQLEGLTHLRQGIGLRGVAQRDPVVEYRRESQQMFDAMQDNVQNEVVKALLHAKKPDVGTPDELSETELTRLAKQADEGSRNQATALQAAVATERPATAKNQQPNSGGDSKVSVSSSVVTGSGDAQETPAISVSSSVVGSNAEQSETKVKGLTEEEIRTQRKKARQTAKKKKAKRKKGRK